MISLREYIFKYRHMKACRERQRAAATIGKLGGKASAEKRRAPIRAKCQQILRELNLPDDPRLA